MRRGTFRGVHPVHALDTHLVDVIFRRFHAGQFIGVKELAILEVEVFSFDGVVVLAHGIPVNLVGPAGAARIGDRDDKVVNLICHERAIIGHRAMKVGAGQHQLGTDVLAIQRDDQVGLSHALERIHTKGEARGRGQIRGEVCRIDIHHFRRRAQELQIVKDSGGPVGVGVIVSRDSQAHANGIRKDATRSRSCIGGIICGAPGLAIGAREEVEHRTHTLHAQPGVGIARTQGRARHAFTRIPTCGQTILGADFILPGRTGGHIAQMTIPRNGGQTTGSIIGPFADHQFGLGPAIRSLEVLHLDHDIEAAGFNRVVIVEGIGGTPNIGATAFDCELCAALGG